MKLYQLLKNVSKWVFNQIEKSGKAISDAEEKIMFAPIDQKPIIWVSHARSFAKAISWRFFGNLISFIIIFGLTHDGKLALAASAIELVIKIVLYYWHERVWDKVAWGRNV